MAEEVTRDSRQHRLIAFDLDDTLAHSKAPIDPEMADALAALLEEFDVLIISGARFQQFEDQVLELMPADDRLERLHLMPTCGTRYMRWHSAGWIEEYAHDLPASSKAMIAVAIEDQSRKLGLWEPAANVWGERIEDRGSQITYSALGQKAPIGAKRKWDPTGEKRARLREAIQAVLPDLEVRGGGATSIDITRKGIDKAYGLGSLMKQMDLTPKEVLFVGDRLEPGGNDYPVVSLGVHTRAVVGPEETLTFIRALLDGASD